MVKHLVNNIPHIFRCKGHELRRATRHNYNQDPDWLPQSSAIEVEPSTRTIRSRSRRHISTSQPCINHQQEMIIISDDDESGDDNHYINVDEIRPILSDPESIYDSLRHVSEKQVQKFAEGVQIEKYLAYFEGYESAVLVSRHELPKTPAGRKLWRRILRLWRAQEKRIRKDPPITDYDSTNQNACNMCLSRPRNALYLPCRHNVICYFCSDEMIRKNTMPLIKDLIDASDLSGRTNEKKVYSFCPICKIEDPKRIKIFIS